MTKKKAERGPGQPTKLTKKTINKICKYIALGMNYKSSAILSGIGYSTFHVWQARGREEEEAGKETEYTKFIDALEKAKIKGELVLVARMQGFSKEGSERATMAILVNRYGDRWKHPNAKIDVSLDKDIVFKIERD